MSVPRAARRTLRAGGLLALAAGLAACHDDPVGPTLEPEGPDAVARGLPAARAAWSQRGPSRYTMRFHWSCFCTADFVSTVLVEVENDAVTSARFEGTGASVGPALLAEYRTVDGLFDFLQDGVDRADWMRAEFDRTLGFPRSAYVDWDRGAADEELGFELLSVTPGP